MYDIPELEKKWRKYKRNKIKKPLIIGSITVVLLLSVGALITTYYVKKSNKVKQEPIVVNKPKKAEPTQGNDSGGAIIIKKVENNQQQPSSNNNIDLSKAEIVKPDVPDDEIRMIGFNKNEKQKVKKKYEDILVPKKTEIDIQNREKAAELEDKFKVSQDPMDSLEVAKFYYKIGNYKKAESWAVNTNNLDGDIEESWLIFAKSRAKQGFRTDAIKVLQSYYDETKSNKAKILLKKLRLGKKY